MSPFRRPGMVMMDREMDKEPRKKKGTGVTCLADRALPFRIRKECSRGKETGVSSCVRACGRCVKRRGRLEDIYGIKYTETFQN
jgi:hypothetical protein